MKTPLLKIFKHLSITTASLLLLVGMLVGYQEGVKAEGITEGITFYLQPNSYWTQDNAKFAIYVCNGGPAAQWVAMSQVGSDNLYQATTPDPGSGAWANIIFVRLKSDCASPDWGCKLNQTGDLTYNGKDNCCTIPDGQWNPGTNVTWSTYDPAASYTLHYEKNGGSGEVPADVDYNAGETVTVTSNTITKEGATFTGWKRSDTGAVLAGGASFGMPSTNLTLTAQFVEPCPGPYYLKHAGWSEGGTDWGWKELTADEGGASFSVIAVYNGTGCNIADNAEYKNACWNDNPSKGTGDRAPETGKLARFTYTPPADCKADCSDKTRLYIEKYEQTPTAYTLHYEKNEGEGEVPADADYNAGETVTVTGNTITKEGATFTGWKRSDTEAVLDGGATFEMPSTNLTLTAQFATGFSSGDLVYLNVTGVNWDQDDNVMYVDFGCGTANEPYDSNKHKAMTRIARAEQNNALYVYQMTSADQSDKRTQLRFRRGNATTLWNHSIVLTANDYQDGKNAATVTDWNNTGSLQSYTCSDFTLSEPSLSIKKEGTVITECQVGDEITFNSTTPTITVGGSNKGILAHPLYTYTYSGGSYSSEQTTSNTQTWTPEAENIAEAGTAGVSASFSVDASNTSSTCNKSGSTTFTIKEKCVPPAVPERIEGAVTVTIDDEVEYTASEVESADTYQWTVPDGWTIQTGEGTRTIGVKVGGTTGQVTLLVNAAKDGCASANQSMDIMVNAKPCSGPYYLKHAGWSERGTDWGWKELTADEGGTSFSVIAVYNGTGCNIADNAEYKDACYNDNPSKGTGDKAPEIGKLARFTYTPPVDCKADCNDKTRLYIEKYEQPCTAGFPISAASTNLRIVSYSQGTVSTTVSTELEDAEAYAWVCTAHPLYGTTNTPVFADATAASTTVTFPIEGSYTLQLKATCDNSEVLSQELTITVSLTLNIKGPATNPEGSWNAYTGMDATDNRYEYAFNAYYSSQYLSEFCLNLAQGTDTAHIHYCDVLDNLNLTGVQRTTRAETPAHCPSETTADNLMISPDILPAGAMGGTAVTLTAEHLGGVQWNVSLSSACTQADSQTIRMDKEVLCGETEATISIDASETGYNYALFQGTTQVGEAQAGTGDALSFPNISAGGTYRVMAAQAGATCSYVPITESKTITRGTGIAIAGDWDDWTWDWDCAGEGTYEKEVTLSEGSYEYKVGLFTPSSTESKYYSSEKKIFNQACDHALSETGYAVNGIIKVAGGTYTLKVDIAQKTLSVTPEEICSSPYQLWVSADNLPVDGDAMTLYSWYYTATCEAKEVSGTWPGTAMQYCGEMDGKYYWSCSLDTVITHFVLNNGKTESAIKYSGEDNGIVSSRVCADEANCIDLSTLSAGAYTWVEATLPVASVEGTAYIALQVAIDATAEEGEMTLLRSTSESASVGKKMDWVMNGDFTIGNLTLTENARMAIGGDTLRVGNLLLTSGATSDATLMKKDDNGEIAVTGTLYLQRTLKSSQKATWSPFAVPFEVNGSTGVYNAANGRKLTCYRDYALQVWDGATRAEYGIPTTEKEDDPSVSWKFTEGTLVPGQGYMVSTNNVPVLLFKATSPADFHLASQDTVLYYPYPSNLPDREAHSGWNFLAQSLTAAATLDFPVGTVVQRVKSAGQYDSEGVYEAVSWTATDVLAPYACFFYQANNVPGGELIYTATSEAATLRSTRPAETTRYELVVEHSQQPALMDRMFWSFHAEATNAYEITRDVMKMGVSDKALQLYAEAYGYPLAAIDAPITNHQVEIPFTVNLPAAGTYLLKALSLPTEEVLLYQQGQLLCKLSEEDYPISVAQAGKMSYRLVVETNEDLPTEVVEETMGIKVYAAAGVVYLQGLDGAAYTVRNTAGLVVAQGMGDASIALPMGIYSIHIGGEVYKILVH